MSDSSPTCPIKPQKGQTSTTTPPKEHVEVHKPRRRYKIGVRYRDSSGRIYYAEPSGALRRRGGVAEVISE